MNRLVPLLLLALLPATLLSGCRTTQREQLFSSSSNGVAEHLEPRRAWRVVEGAGAPGIVIYFESSQKPEAAFYSVRNAWQQELGMVDSLGRAWRFRPHGEEAEWAGTGTVIDGARLILDLSEAAHLEEVPLDELLPPGDAE